MLESRFTTLHDQLKSELTDKKIPVDEILHSLTRLPIDLKFEHDEIIESKLPTAEKARNINQLFFRINPLFTFIDYRLLIYLISQYGSTGLKIDAASYAQDIELFMRRTTVGDLLSHNWVGKKLCSDDFKELWVKIKDDPQTYTLEKLNALRKRHCANIKLSAVLSAIVNLTPAGSFYAVWSVPTLAVDEVKKAIRQVDAGFYKSERIVMIILDDKLLYLSDTVPIKL